MKDKILVCVDDWTRREYKEILILSTHHKLIYGQMKKKIEW